MWERGGRRGRVSVLIRPGGLEGPQDGTYCWGRAGELFIRQAQATAEWAEHNQSFIARMRDGEHIPSSI